MNKKMNGDVKQFVPSLRFQSFKASGPWEFKPLSQLAQRSTRKNVDGKITRVLTNSAEFGVIDQRDFFEKDIANQGNLQGYYVVEEGSYVYNPRISTMAPVGPISKNKIGLGVMSPLYTIFKFNNRENDFYAHYFKSTHWHQYMRQVSSTGARHDRMSISNNAFMELPLPVSTPKEQEKIADCLSSLDDLLTAEAQKLDALKKYKKGVLQQIFPREGEAVPRLRFPKFRESEKWNTVVVAEICEVNPSKASRQDNELVSFIPMASVSEDGRITNPEIRAYADVKKGYTAFAENDVIIAKITPCFENGKAAIARGLKNGLGFGSTEFHVFRASKSCLPEFLFLQLYRDEVRTVGARSMIGNAGQRRVPVSFFESLPFYLPSIDEQQMIVGFLSTLDEQLSAIKKQIDILKTHKKGLMQQLFPVFDRISA
ncbi:restriction endonuclease subunit S [Citrobacter sp. C5_2]|uniref:restriction endonuclease subunit S n=1 Tax=Citrobacter TaxID=544 RepID=UPI001CAA85C4|nr:MULTISPECIES: restriction endonuclease subunit S [Citrobacter]